MSINAINSVNAQRSSYADSVQNHSNVNFGRKPFEGETKSHKKAYIALGVTAGLAVLAFAFRKKISNLSIFKKLGKDVKNTNVKVKEKVKNEVITEVKTEVNKAKDVVKDAAETVKDKAAETVEKTKAAAKPAFKKAVMIFESDKITAQEKEILKGFFEKGKNKDGVYQILRNHGMTKEQEVLVRDTVPYLKRRFAERGLKTKPFTERFFLSSSFKAETPEKVVEYLVNDMIKIREAYPVK